MGDWGDLRERALERYRAGERDLADDADERQRQLTRMGNAAGAAALCSLMAGRDDAREWFARAAERYRESWPDARWALEAGAAESESPIGRYAAALALLVLGDWHGARVAADYARTHETFPDEVADALAFIAVEDVVGYVEAVEAVLESFETRDAYLEDIPVADTVLVLQALAGRRGISAELESELLPGSTP